MSLRYLIFMRCLHKWFEFASVTCIETAEDLVVFQTKNLDTYDQTFHGTYEDVSENDYDPVRAAAIGSAGKHKGKLMVLHASDLEAKNTLGKPETVIPIESAVELEAPATEVSVQPLSFLVYRISL